ncbi:hypothetical protein C0991_003909 [Blastosporella zonata]|nr:hypothetical protein C0991_003909 [Blastosporella zonata]
MTSPDPPKHSLSNLDDDLDDLDDVLDQFTPGAPPPPPPTATTATFGNRPRTNTRVDAPPKSVPGGLGLEPTSEADEDELAAEFQRELVKGMESLMREISLAEPGLAEEKGKGKGKTTETSKEGTGEGGGLMDDEELAKAFKTAWEQMLVDGMDGMPGHDLGGLEEFLGNGPKESKGEGVQKNTAGTAPPKTDFQSKIQQTLEKMRESESALKDSTSKSSTSAGGLPNDLEALLASMGDGENDDEIAGLFDTMMAELMSKQVLYEPIKELSEKYPEYLANLTAPIPDEDRKRYELQQACAKKILATFDDPSYKDTDPAMAEKMTTLMAEMQSHGEPPNEIMGQLPSGLEGLSKGDCVIA